MRGDRRVAVTAMCGRYSLIATPEQLIAHFRLQRLPRYQPHFNIAPAQKILTVVELENASLKAVNLYWGLVPSWAKDRKISQHMINARAETVHEKPSFRAAYRQRRCLIPATGFYEWQQNPDGKQPYHIHRRDDALFAFAGLWEHWQHETETLYSCTIITTAAAEFMQAIHARMPVIIPENHYGEWLDRNSPEAEVAALLNNSAYQAMTATAVSDWVNNPLHDDERCLLK